MLLHADVDAVSRAYALRHALRVRARGSVG